MRVMSYQTRPADQTRTPPADEQAERPGRRSQLSWVCFGTGAVAALLIAAVWMVDGRQHEVAASSGLTFELVDFFVIYGGFGSFWLAGYSVMAAIGAIFHRERCPFLLSAGCVLAAYPL